MTRNTVVQDIPVRFGTRGSALARAQTRLVIDRFQRAHPGLATEIQVIRTEGDIDQTSPLTEIGGRGVFTSALEAAILRGEIDAAVHSAKDLPSQVHPAVPVVAFPSRDDPRDVLVSRHGTTLDRLPAEPVIGTSSRRRDSQITRLRPDARIRSLRGNIDTRLRKADGPEFDAIVIAAAGIRRMGWDDRITEVFPVERLVPAPGQGALAVQARADSDVAALLASIDDSTVSRPVRIERAFLAAVGAGCSYPLGAYARSVEGVFQFVAMLADADGERVATADEWLATGDEQRHAAEIAARLAAQIGVAPANGKRAWNGWAPEDHGLTGARVVVTRPRQQAGPLLQALTASGAIPLLLPTIRIAPMVENDALDSALVAASQGVFDWVAFTSANAVSAVAQRVADLDIQPDHLAGVRVAAIGPATAAAATESGFAVALTPATATAEALAAALREALRPGDRVLYPRSAIGRDVLPEALRRAGVAVTAISVYRTLPDPDVDPEVFSQIKRGEIDAIHFASPSSVRNFVALLGQDRDTIADLPAICAGPVTARAARDEGFSRVVIGDDPGPEALAAAVAAQFVSHRRADHPRANAEFMQLAGRSAE
jgi:hydroxymethylbilane synthase